uniref:PUM-HD domain-containing protein n=1 Tax=Zooxanthella nutricula TaxID=1333877 RepID=A0A7S2LBI1_9DINO|mmetsp:Transcript_59178/g.180465  ORF Transcript_59178/g.180465 Transcript_59178/m.180465 type:complete len:366 (+) Transcript_59178:78-1175(+)
MAVAMQASSWSPQPVISGAFVLPFAPYMQVQGLVAPCPQAVALPAQGPFKPGLVAQPRCLSHPAGPPPQVAQGTPRARAPAEAAGVEALARIAQESSSEGQRQDAVIVRHALRLSHDREGSHVLQGALDAAQSDEVRIAIAEALRGHIWEVARCSHGNHVLQRIVISIKPSDCQFIIDEITARGGEAPGKLARHRFAYRVVQRLLEQLHQWQVVPLVEQVIADCVALSMHRFGTYVVQHALVYGSEEQQVRLMDKLARDIPQLSRNNDACMVLDQALAAGGERHQAAFAQALLDCDGALADMAHTRRGHVAVLSLLQLAGGDLLDRAHLQLVARQRSLRSTRFGRVVLNAIAPQSGGHLVGGCGR